MIYLPDSENLHKKIFWLCRLRWFAVAGILFSTIIAKLTLNLQIDFVPLYLIACLLAISNLIHLLLLKYFLKKGRDKTILKLRYNINIQILSDFIFLTLLLHFSGGIENPFIIFYIFHMIISSILLSKRMTYIHTTIGILLFASLAITESLGIVPHYSINKYISLLIHNDPAYLFSALLIFSLSSYLVVFITSSLFERLRIVEQKLKEANNDLLEKDKIKDEYVKRLTHDIKGHISAIKINLEVVQNQFVAPLDEKNKEYIEKAYNRTQRMNEFIYDLLSLSNMRLKNKFDKENFEIEEMLNSALNLNQSFADSKNITISTEFNISNPNYKGIRSSIEEVVSNLIQNAIKYTPIGGKVNINAVSDNIHFNVVVTDTGFGIPKEDLPFIFDEFYRASNVKNTIKDGTGLGLSLVKTIVERHLGTVRAESTQGKGSKFIVNLPHIP